ncbi:MAG: ribonuclease HII [Candidatus Latescibacterota bacterium]|nr:ribonuclease HII [Candidatus Latescibacterota bacterium]
MPKGVSCLAVGTKQIEKATVAEIEAYVREHGINRSVLSALERDRRIGVRRIAVRERRRQSGVRAEQVRQRKICEIECSHWAKGRYHVAGVDEVGRGCLAGPVVAAAVILPPWIELPGIDDSKEIEEENRESLAQQIQRQATAWQVASVHSEQIDRINILEASMEAMRQCLRGLSVSPDHVLVDGSRVPGGSFPETAVVDGDARSVTIAAASIVAKVRRDYMMAQYDKSFPEYGFASNKGYASAQHRQALRTYGPCPLHRRSFAPLSLPPHDQMSLGLPHTGGSVTKSSVGKRGELAATDYLIAAGYRILERGYRGAGAEIDLIAEHAGCLVFAEVKGTNKGSALHSEGGVDAGKQSDLIRAARHFLAGLRQPRESRFDVVAVDLSTDPACVTHFEDAFPATI